MGGGWEGWLCGCSKDFDRGGFFFRGVDSMAIIEKIRLEICLFAN